MLFRSIRSHSISRMEDPRWADTSVVVNRCVVISIVRKKAFRILYESPSTSRLCHLLQDHLRPVHFIQDQLPNPARNDLVPKPRHQALEPMRGDTSQRRELHPLRFRKVPPHRRRSWVAYPGAVREALAQAPPTRRGEVRWVKQSEEMLD